MIMTLPQDMDALVLNGIRDFSIKTIPVPVPDVDDVICKVDTTYAVQILILQEAIFPVSGQQRLILYLDTNGQERQSKWGRELRNWDGKKVTGYVEYHIVAVVTAKCA